MLTDAPNAPAAAMGDGGRRYKDDDDVVVRWGEEGEEGKFYLATIDEVLDDGQYYVRYGESGKKGVVWGKWENALNALTFP